jgi:hypothetical protein
MKPFFRRLAGMGGAILAPVLAPILGIAALAGGGLGAIAVMPGVSHKGPLPHWTVEERDLAARLRTHVTAIASVEHNVAHHQELEEAARYIDRTLSGYGFTVKSQEFKADGKPVRNLEVSIAGKGAEAQRDVIVVGAHYDSVIGAPGANDNGSGTAAVIELARLLKGAALPDKKELKLVLFVNEEPPYFKSEQMGSHVHARDLKSRGRKVTAMLSLETIGYYSDEKGSQHYPPPLDALYPDTGNFIGFVGDMGSRMLVHQAIATFRKHAAFPSEGIAAPSAIPGIDWSDHWAYRQYGYPAIMITDTAPYRYPHYHTAQDTPDKIDYERTARVVKGIEAIVRELAGAR